ncbi:MAG: hypothetical protein QNJ82_05645 [Gammaproteobacteria bacterium]|nr:hypothetical protein [Gammaproteobacteria bacterium]
MESPADDDASMRGVRAGTAIGDLFPGAAEECASFMGAVDRIGDLLGESSRQELD